MRCISAVTLQIDGSSVVWLSPDAVVLTDRPMLHYMLLITRVTDAVC